MSASFYLPHAFEVLARQFVLILLFCHCGFSVGGVTGGPLRADRRAARRRCRRCESTANTAQPGATVSRPLQPLIRHDGVTDRRRTDLGGRTARLPWHSAGADGASARASLPTPTPGPARARASDRLGPPWTGRSVHGAVQASSRYSETWMFSQLPRCAIDSARADRRLPASISRAGISLRRRGT